MRFKKSDGMQLIRIGSLLPGLLIVVALWLSYEALQVAVTGAANRQRYEGQQALRAHPTDPYTQLAWLQTLDGRSLRGRAYGQAEALIVLATQVASLAPSDPYFQYMLGTLVLDRTTDPYAALAFFHQALQLDPSYTEQILYAYTRHLDEATALRHFTRAIPDTPQGHLSAARALEKKSWHHARRHYHAAFAIAKSDPAIIRAYATALQRHHAFDAARDIWKQLVRLEPEDAGAYLGLADAYRQLGNNAAFVTILQRLVDRFPRQAGYRDRLAEAYLQLGQPAAAEAEWRILMQTLPQSVEGYLGLARLYESRRNYAAAIAMLQRVVEMAPGIIPYHHRLARLYEKNAEGVKALQEHQRLVALRPDSATVFYQLGEYFRRSGQYQRAIASYRKALALAPQAVLYLRQMGLAYAAGKDHQQAIALYRQVLKQQPDDAHAYYYLGLSYEASGETDLARKAYRKAIALDPTHSGFRRALENFARRSDG